MKRGKDFWGPVLWTLIHLLALASVRPEYFIEFLWILTRLLPCDYCKNNLITKLKSHPPEKYIEILFKYSYIVHDLANKHITKIHPAEPKISPPYNEVYAWYTGRLYNTLLWEEILWKTLFILSATLREENAKYFLRLLHILPFMIPIRSIHDPLSNIIQSNDPIRYLRNNHDAFFYVYTIYSKYNRIHGKQTHHFIDIKSRYFSALGEECNECQM